MLFLHGFATTATECWIRTGWARRFRDRDLVLVQLPGHEDPELVGADSVVLPMVGPTTVGGVVDVLARFLDELPGSVDAVGYSLGARIAWELAGTRPDLVERAVLGGLPAHDVVADLREAGPDAGGPGSRADEVAPRATADPTGSAPTRSARSAAEAEVLDLMGRAIAPGRPLASRPLPRMLADTGRERFSPAAAPPAGPVLLVRGTDDVVAADSETLLPLLDRPRHLLLPGRGHVDALTSGIFRREAARFLARVPEEDPSRQEVRPG